ncbi:glycerophosphodiester phosphodiesterase [Paenibacillus montanisoli]|uniref:Glycerophosphodiester phosphodiesterase n=1 Tax=Paenibacillus montanisoli TaxID=2081970 RepID=A0A328TXY1_9BACL|nr:glycerophosphodiester phosphodiesterase [Paenibacillus montanisoli]RAP74572.1 glycerophosphodiester phosphodiesterase [Paenibacillus montanisoli]
MRETLICAHTGCGVHPDNTVDSFLEAIEAGAHIAEVDVLAAADGTAILLHDDSPLLQTNGYAQLNRQEVRRLLDPVYERYELATLDQIFRMSAQKDLLLNLDLKADAAIEPAVRLIRRNGAENRVYITGFLEGITERHPDIQVMLNTPRELNERQLASYNEYAESVCRAAVMAGYAGLNMNAATCLDPVVKHAHAVGLLVWVYTVNDQLAMQRYIDMGVDAITTRAPKELRKLI